MLFVNDDLQQISIWNQISVQSAFRVNSATNPFGSLVFGMVTTISWLYTSLAVHYLLRIQICRWFEFVWFFSHNSRNCRRSRWLWTLNKNDRNHHECLIILKRLTTLNVQDDNMSLNITCICPKGKPKTQWTFRSIICAIGTQRLSDENKFQNW